VWSTIRNMLANGRLLIVSALGQTPADCVGNKTRMGVVVSTVRTGPIDDFSTNALEGVLVSFFEIVGYNARLAGKGDFFRKVVGTPGDSFCYREIVGIEEGSEETKVGCGVLDNCCLIGSDVLDLFCRSDSAPIGSTSPSKAKT